MALTANLATFRALYPEFAAVPDETVQALLGLAAETLSEAGWGACYQRAQLVWVAHRLQLRKMREIAEASGTAMQVGAIASASAEGLAVSFVQPSNATAASAWYAQTPYGLEYLTMQRECLSVGGLSW